MERPCSIPKCRRGSSVPARSRTEPRRYDVDGFAVVEVRGGSPDYVSATAQGYARRIAGFGGFAVAATAAAVKLPRPDVVFATSPALTVAVPGLLAARRHRAPLVFEVRDLWPRAPIEMGALPNPVAQALARGMEKAAYRGAAHVVALSPGMREGVVAAGVDPARVTLIPNAADLDLFAPDVDPGQIGERFGDDFVCSYFGTMGEANDLDQVVRAATVLADRGEKGVTFALDGRRQAPPRAGGGGRPPRTVQRRSAARGRQGRRRPPGRRLGRLPDGVQGRARAGHQLAEQAVRHVRRGASGHREHGRLAARAGGGQPGRRVRSPGGPRGPGRPRAGPARRSRAGPLDGRERPPPGRGPVRPSRPGRAAARRARARGGRGS
ncbi:MAG: glycosyltransferase [Thermoleophilaceae bacterium]